MYVFMSCIPHLFSFFHFIPTTALLGRLDWEFVTGPRPPVSFYGKAEIWTKVLQIIVWHSNHYTILSLQLPFATNEHWFHLKSNILLPLFKGTEAARKITFAVNPEANCYNGKIPSECINNPRSLLGGCQYFQGYLPVLQRLLAYYSLVSCSHIKSKNLIHSIFYYIARDPPHFGLHGEDTWADKMAWNTFPPYAEHWNPEYCLGHSTPSINLCKTWSGEKRYLRYVLIHYTDYPNKLLEEVLPVCHVNWGGDRIFLGSIKIVMDHSSEFCLIISL